MTEFLDFNLNQAYAEIKEKAEAEPVTSREAWDSMVDEYINELLDRGELSYDNDTEGMSVQLKNMWPEYEKNMTIR